MTAVTATIGLAATLCWLRRWQSGSGRWSVAGAFFLGLGLYAKFLFVWLIAALLGGIILLNLSWLIKFRHKIIDFAKTHQAEIIGSGLAFMLGCWPLIMYNLQTGGTFLNISQNAATSYYGVDNLAFGTNLLERLSQFIILLNGSHLWYLGKIITNPLPSLMFIGVAILVVYLATRSIVNRPNIWVSRASLRCPNPTKVALFPLLVIGLLILFSIATVSALWITHFALLMPWPALALAIGGWYIHHSVLLESRLKITIVIWVGLILLTTTNLLTTIRYHQTLTESGGLSSHSDAIYDLSDWLARHTTGQVVAMDWGLAAPVTYLTHGQVTPTEVFGYAWQPNPDLTGLLETFIAQPANLYLWRAPDEIIFDRSQEFKALYQPRQLVEQIEAAFYERSGRPILGVTRLVPCGTPGIISPEPPDHCR